MNPIDFLTKWPTEGKPIVKPNMKLILTIIQVDSLIGTILMKFKISIQWPYLSKETIKKYKI